ncbi:serine/threonine protein kinase [Stutzerimonas zhaodongensis]|uniref:Serine/threonine protein kinase n=1 Tax=Stutzerimonas zhaodongensis TaxID=1176257 RepID=A0A3M2HW42_9GAMM|nr:lipopolysaccharide kinase InaA family protein [Stutzerimonas zhaodongensis]MCQ4315487.1 lipopolysaccharide kinase InaA family protein [Stutzerimonas zhaodongensis]RMH91639.1 serine/threonine protein kinase [Stutzerimonas zhaodongensis]
MTLGELARAGRAPALPLTLHVDELGELIVEHWLRVLPGQRYVGRAQWNGRTVLAKLMVGGKAHRHYIRERDGAALLAEQGLPTPELLSEGWNAGSGGWLLFDFLLDAQSLWSRWQALERDPPLTDAQQAVLGSALELIAHMHMRGLWQDDLHLDNLLMQAGVLHVVDGGGVMAQQPGQPLDRAQALANLGVFFAQLPASLDAHIEELLVHYLLANSSHALPMEMLLKDIRKVRAWRMADFIKKVGRDCSLFSARIGAFGADVIRREEVEPLETLVADPDSFIAAGQLYKDGGTATVARVELDNGRPLIVKRYNIKGPVHWLKRFWRPSRAWHSWVEGNRLAFLGIATPRLLAVKEQRWLWLRGRAWLITELLAGEDIIACFRPYLDSSPPEEQLSALERLLETLIRERISHGDLKGHNLFWDQGQWTLIDLDAVQQHRSAASFARAYAKDRARLLRNWPADSALYRLLDQRLPAVPGTRIED